MDITVFSSPIKFFKEALSLVKDVKEGFPDGVKKDAIERALNKAETEFGVAAADAAVHFGYPICRKHFPPEIMIETNQNSLFKCPVCGKEVDTKPVSLGRGVVNSGLRRSLDHY